ncbi:MAG: hypothetical protein VW080_11935, partial [Flavobacteriaceae bacterium]
MSRHLLFVLFLLLFGGYPVFGQCSGSLYFKDGDGDGFGTELFDSTNTHLVEINFMTAGDGKTVYIGNVAFG